MWRRRSVMLALLLMSSHDRQPTAICLDGYRLSVTLSRHGCSGLPRLLCLLASKSLVFVINGKQESAGCPDRIRFRFKQLPWSCFADHAASSGREEEGDRGRGQGPEVRDRRRHRAHHEEPQTARTSARAYPCTPALTADPSIVPVCGFQAYCQGRLGMVGQAVCIEQCGASVSAAA